MGTCGHLLLQVCALKLAQTSFIHLLAPLGWVGCDAWPSWQSSKVAPELRNKVAERGVRSGPHQLEHSRLHQRALQTSQSPAARSQRQPVSNACPGLPHSHRRSLSCPLHHPVCPLCDVPASLNAGAPRLQPHSAVPTEAPAWTENSGVAPADSGSGRGSGRQGPPPQCRQIWERSECRCVRHLAPP